MKPAAAGRNCRRAEVEAGPDLPWNEDNPMLDDILKEMKQVAEGVKTTKVAKALAQKLGCDAPIIDAMHAIIHEGVPVRDVMTRLLSRPPKMERD